MDLVESAGWGPPHLPVAPSLSIDGFSLAAIRDTMTEMPPDATVAQAVTSVIARWREDPRSVQPVYEMRQALELVRALPRGDRRLQAMNTFVRTLGQPEALATFLDMMRDAAHRSGTREEELTRMSRDATKHCIYGWAGQTLLFASEAEPTAGTLPPEPGVRELIGGPDPAIWGLSLHIWQPNPNAKGFLSGGRIARGLVVEPPHSHPFDFASMVTVGRMRQSIYAQRSPDDVLADTGGRYDGVPLEHVDGVWPEHTFRSSCEVRTVEAGVDLAALDSYYLPCDMIHDVEFDIEVARSTPAVTLFLAAEIVVRPHVYMAASMADTHAAHPLLKEQGRALTADSWHAKLEAVSAYLRGERSTLRLDEIVSCDDEYAFFHL